MVQTHSATNTHSHIHARTTHNIYFHTLLGQVIIYYMNADKVQITRALEHAFSRRINSHVWNLIARVLKHTHTYTQRFADGDRELVVGVCVCVFCILPCSSDGKHTHEHAASERPEWAHLDEFRNHIRQHASEQAEHAHAHISLMPRRRRCLAHSCAPNPLPKTHTHSLCRFGERHSNVHKYRQVNY